MYLASYLAAGLSQEPMVGNAALLGFKPDKIIYLPFYYIIVHVQKNIQAENIKLEAGFYEFWLIHNGNTTR